MTEIQRQRDVILAHLRSGQPITSLEALRDYGCIRLAARIFEIREAGHNIVSQMVQVDNGKCVAEYRLVV